MPRHSFIQITKLTNVCGRIGYISSTEKQEFLYETYDTAGEDEGFWEDLANESQEDYWTYASGGSCIEARELIISLPENYTDYTPESVLKLFCESFKEKYGVECIAAIHHNKTKVNYHMHLIFSERKKLEQPIEKIATRNMFYDEEGYHVRTKKEILDESGNVRKGCTIVKKGEVYERHIFNKKNPYFKSRAFLKEIKDFYTELINENVKDPEKKLKVFDKNDVYVAQKKIGKGNPKEELIKANNEDAKEWNRLADYAMKVGVKKEKVMAVKEIEIKEAAKKSI